VTAFVGAGAGNMGGGTNYDCYAVITGDATSLVATVAAS
jgi:hypothetical protein